MAVRVKGDWEGWLRFFLRGVVQTAREATATAERIFELREAHRTMIIERGLGDNALRLLSALFQRPLLNVNLATEILGDDLSDREPPGRGPRGPRDPGGDHRPQTFADLSLRALHQPLRRPAGPR